MVRQIYKLHVSCESLNCLNDFLRLVWIYPLVKWVEIEFTVTLGVGSKSVTTYDFKNMQYQITAGVDFELYTYSGGEQRDI